MTTYDRIIQCLRNATKTKDQAPISRAKIFVEDFYGVLMDILRSSVEIVKTPRELYNPENQYAEKIARECVKKAANEIFLLSYNHIIDVESGWTPNGMELEMKYYVSAYRKYTDAYPELELPGRVLQNLIRGIDVISNDPLTTLYRNAAADTSDTFPVDLAYVMLLPEYNAAGTFWDLVYGAYLAENDEYQKILHRSST